MKQVFTYVSPDKKFNEEHSKLVKLQIDNSLDLGWKPDDIILATNFPYEYRGIESVIVRDNNYCQIHWPATKIYTLIDLFRMKLIGDDLHWYHDFDCYQLNPIKEYEVEMNMCDLGVSNYGQRERLCSASMFFKKKAEDIFYWIKSEVNNHRVSEERALMRAYYQNAGNLRSRIKRINTTFAFHKFNIIPTYKTTLKPIRAAHFHPTPDKFEFYIQGRNKLNRPILPERLIKIFDKYGFK